MKKFIPTIFAITLAISSVSLLIGCSGDIPEDPEAAAKEAENKKGPDASPEKGSGVKDLSDNPADGGFKEGK